MTPDVSAALRPWFYWDDPLGDVELVRIPPAPSIECKSGSGISGSLCLAGRDDGQDAS
jgi:hypothetical protein